MSVCVEKIEKCFLLDTLYNPTKTHYYYAFVEKPGMLPLKSWKLWKINPLTILKWYAGLHTKWMKQQ